MNVQAYTIKISFAKTTITESKNSTGFSEQDLLFNRLKIAIPDARNVHRASALADYRYSSGSGMSSNNSRSTYNHCLKSFVASPIWGHHNGASEMPHLP